MIEVKNITKIYGKKKNAFTALDDVSLNIEEGSSVAILGKSGSGKSTLMHAISGLDKPQKGKVLIDGEDILRLRPRATDRFRAQKMGFIFQSFFVEGGESCYDNVSLALETAGVARIGRKKRIIEALEAVDLGDKIKSRAKDLSGGQKQRVGIARAIMQKPKLLLCDEPIASLDPKTAENIMDYLKKIVTELKITCIVNLHQVDIAKKYSDRIIALNKGEKIFDDKAEKLTEKMVEFIYKDEE